MRPLSAAVCLFAALALAPARAATPGLPLVPLGYCQITLGADAVGFAAACTNGLPASANVAVISVETAAVRWRDDGTAPTASIGMPIAAGAVPFIYTGTPSAIEFIAQSGSPVIDVSFYRSP
jgi:hypothetical protein